jgi:cysteine desulfurase
MTHGIYLDNNATTRVDPRVVEAMVPYFGAEYGNAASRQHAFGRKALEAVEEARCHIASLIGAESRELIFTSGATESNNLAILGAAFGRKDFGDHIVTAAGEHPSVLDPCRHLEKQGFRVTVLAIDRHGRVDPEQVAGAITDQTILVSIMMANNEVGTLQPVAEIARICRDRGVLFHTDAVQGLGKIPIDVRAIGADLASFSAHKVYGPKGIGALYVRGGRPRVALHPLVHGGGHERGLRSGTLPVPLIVGFGEACRLCQASLANEALRIGSLHDHLWQQIQKALPDAVLNGHPTERLPGTLNASFPYIDADALMLQMPEVAVSTGSACTSASIEPSHVLKAMGLDDEAARSSLRFSLGRFTTAEEIDAVSDAVISAVARLRAISPAYQLHLAETSR